MSLDQHEGTESILDEAKRIVSGPRAQAYGTANVNHQRIAAIWSVLLGIPISPRQAALCMAGVKLAREAHTPKRDNLVDLAGYADVASRCSSAPIMPVTDDEPGSAPPRGFQIPPSDPLKAAEAREAFAAMGGTRLAATLQVDADEVAPTMIYLASPYTNADPAVVADRYWEACGCAAALMKAGYVVFSPVAHSHHIADFGLSQDLAFWLAQDMPLLRACDEVWVLLLDGWKESKGIIAEVALAKKLGKPVRGVRMKDGEAVVDAAVLI